MGDEQPCFCRQPRSPPGLALRPCLACSRRSTLPKPCPPQLLLPIACPSPLLSRLLSRPFSIVHCAPRLRHRPRRILEPVQHSIHSREGYYNHRSFGFVTTLFLFPPFVLSSMTLRPHTARPSPPSPVVPECVRVCMTVTVIPLAHATNNARG